jgi:hypothetical protein
MADRGTGCGEMVRGGCLFAWNFIVTRSAVLMETESKALGQTWCCHCTSDSLLAYHFKILPAKNHALNCTFSHASSLMETSYLIGQIFNHVYESSLSKQLKIFMCLYGTFNLVYEYHLVAQWLRYCATNRKFAGSIPDGVIGFFHWLNPSDRTIALGSTQPLTEMSTRSISWGQRWPVCKADNLTTILCRCHVIWET